MSSRLITLCIHTYEHAVALRQLLQEEGIPVELNNVNLAEPSVSPGVRVRISEEDLPLALRIVENIEIFRPRHTAGSDPQGTVLFPTDFSETSRRAIATAFSLAQMLGCRLVFLHSYLPAGTAAPSLQLAEVYRYGERADKGEAARAKEEAERTMAQLGDYLRSLIKEGKLPPVKFSWVITEGLPEEAILEYTRQHAPRLIVMGTRGKARKETDLIGSVTAEVLDDCRVPAFTLPETVDSEPLANIQRVAFFSNLDQEDMLAIDTLRRLFPKMHVEVTIIHVPGKREHRTQNRQAANNLLRYCEEHYGDTLKFELREVALPTIVEDFHTLDRELPFQLICLPNKRRSVFTRLFNPSLAHKILFQADIPMMVIPV